MKQFFFIFTVLLLLIGLLGYIGSLFFGEGDETTKILYVNSYHEGYGSSDEVMRGIQSTLDSSIALHILFMDTKRHPAESHALQKVEEATKTIEAWEPHCLIVSDDNAVKYLVAPHLKDGPLPVVFCGVNWSCEPYGLPTDHVTGMLEVLPLQPTIAILKNYYPNAKRLTVLSENTTSSQNNRKFLDPEYKKAGLNPTYALVDTFEAWKQAFIRANRESDLIYLPTNGAIQDWDNQAATQFVEENIKKPVFTCADFMMPFAVLGLTKVAREQGEWAAKTAMRILDNEDIGPGDIPIAKNEKTEAYINPKLAEIIDFRPEADLLARCKPYGRISDKNE